MQINSRKWISNFIYVDATKGWRIIFKIQHQMEEVSFITATGGTITTCGNFKIHTFTGPGTFCSFFK